MKLTVNLRDLPRTSRPARFGVMHVQWQDKHKRRHLDQSTEEGGTKTNLSPEMMKFRNLVHASYSQLQLDYGRVPLLLCSPSQVSEELVL